MLLNYGAGEDSWQSLGQTERRSNQSILKETNPEYSLEGLKLKLQYSGHLVRRADSWEKVLMLGKTEGRRRGRQDEMVGWHHWLNGHESEQIPGDSEGQGSLASCSPWSRNESDTAERLNNNSTSLRATGEKPVWHPASFSTLGWWTWKGRRTLRCTW